MPLVNGAQPVNMLRAFKVASIVGRFGGGKTSLAFYLAHELCERWGFRHIVSNVKSVWNSNPADIEFVNKQLDTVVILDEGGIFLEDTYSAKRFTAFLRKMNIIVIIPSVQPPTTKLKFLQFQRTYNGEAFGLPVWFYNGFLSSGAQTEKFRFQWAFPRQIFGVYDTEGAPDDDNGLGDRFDYWVEEYKRLSGSAGQRYTDPPRIAAGASGKQSAGRRAEKVGAGGLGLSDVEALRRLPTEINEATEELARTISLSEQNGKRGGRKR